MNPAVTSYIKSIANDQQQILQHLRDLIHKTVPGVSEEIKWGRPVFKTGSTDFAYLKTAKAYVTLGFFDATSFIDDSGLEGTGKNMRHIKIGKLTDIDSALLASWLKAAAKLTNH